MAELSDMSAQLITIQAQVITAEAEKDAYAMECKTLQTNIAVEQETTDGYRKRMTSLQVDLHQLKVQAQHVLSCIYHCTSRLE